MPPVASMPIPQKFSIPSPPPLIAHTPSPSDAAILATKRSYEPYERSVVEWPTVSVTVYETELPVTCPKTTTCVLSSVISTPRRYGIELCHIRAPFDGSSFAT